MKTPVSNVKIKYETLVTMWAALLSSQFLFLVLIFIIKPGLFSFDFSQPFFGDQPLIVFLFAVAAIVFFILSFVLRNQHIRRSVVDQDAGCVQTGLVLGCALSEMSSLLGLVLAFAFDYPYSFLWIALGIIGVLFHFPRRDNLLAAQYKNPGIG